MNPARRLYGKPSPSSPSQLPNSPFFLSKVRRQLNPQTGNKLGPGQYQISLPLVKPTYETILKNDRTVIVKFNHNFSSAFHSKSPRFKHLYGQESQNKNSKSFKDRTFSCRERGNKCGDQEQYGGGDCEMMIGHAKLERQLSRSLIVSEMNQSKTIQESMGCSTDNRPSHKNNTLKHRKSTKGNTLTNTILLTVQQTIPTDSGPYKYGTQDSHPTRTLPAALRLHHLQPNIVETQRLQSNRYNSTIKSTEWSKYKLERKSFVDNTTGDNSLPGPGTYAVKEPKFRTYNEVAEITSWQFSSKTARGQFDRNKGGYQEIRSKLMSHSMRYEIKEKEQSQVRSKQRSLTKKQSIKKIGSFRQEKRTELSTRTNFQPYFNLNFTAIHSRENLFGDNDGNGNK